MVMCISFCDFKELSMHILVCRGQVCDFYTTGRSCICWCHVVFDLRLSLCDCVV